MAKIVRLPSGFSCPTLGLGTLRVNDPAVLIEAIKVAVKSGYRHIDTAAMYGNEGIIGQALGEIFADGLVKREEIFVTTKLLRSNNEPERVVPALRKQLELLRLDYVDLYLIHHSACFKYTDGAHHLDEDGNYVLNTKTTIEETWVAMEECVTLGLARSIGISNFNESQVERILKIAKIKPVTNQIEIHPYFQNTALLDFCHQRNIIVTGYAPFGSPGTGRIQDLLQDERLVKIAQKYGKNAAQVALRWQIQRGAIVIPKSENPTRIIDNGNIWDFELSAEDMAAIATMDTNKRVFTGLHFKGSEFHPEFPWPEYKR